MRVALLNQGVTMEVDLFNKPYDDNSKVNFRVMDSLELEKQHIFLDDNGNMVDIGDTKFDDCGFYIGDDKVGGKDNITS